MEPHRKKVDETIDEFLGGGPRAGELKSMADVLAARLGEKRHELPELAEGSPEREMLEAEIKELEQQVLILRREEAISQFVEDSVRMTLATSEMLEGGEEMELYEEQDWKPSGLAELDEDEDE